MKKVLLIAAFIGSVYGEEIPVSSWGEFAELCTKRENPDFEGGEYVYSGYPDVRLSANCALPDSTSFVINGYMCLHGNYEFSIGVGSRVSIPEGCQLYIDCGEFYGPNRDGTIDSYTQANIEVDGVLYNLVGSTTGSVIGTKNVYSQLTLTGSGNVINGQRTSGKRQYVSVRGNYSKLVFGGNLLVNNYCEMYTDALNSSMIFADSVKFNNSYTVGLNGENSSITFSNEQGVMNYYTISCNGNGVSVVISDKCTVKSSGGSLIGGNNYDQKLLVDGNLIFEKGDGEDGRWPGFYTSDDSYHNMVVCGTGTIDMSNLEGGTVKILAKAFTNDDPFVGTIKIPSNLTCSSLNLSNTNGATILVPGLEYKCMGLLENRITKVPAMKPRFSIAELTSMNITLPENYDMYSNTYYVGVGPDDPLTLPDIIKSEYNVVGNYVVTDELDETLYEIQEGENVVVNFSIKGETPLDLRGKGKITFKGDNSEYRIPRPMIRFEGKNAVFPRDAIYDQVEFAEGTVIPENTIIIAKNPQDLSNVTIKGKLVF